MDLHTKYDYLTGNNDDNAPKTLRESSLRDMLVGASGRVSQAKQVEGKGRKAIPCLSFSLYYLIYCIFALSTQICQIHDSVISYWSSKWIVGKTREYGD